MKVKNIPIVEDQGLWLKGWEARFSGGESYFKDAIQEIFYDWIQMEYVGVKKINKWYDEISSGIPRHELIKGSKLHCALKEYGLMMGLYDYEYLGENKQSFSDGQDRAVKITKVKKDDGWDDYQNILTDDQTF